MRKAIRLHRFMVWIKNGNVSVGVKKFPGVRRSHHQSARRKGRKILLFHTFFCHFFSSALFFPFSCYEQKFPRHNTSTYLWFYSISSHFSDTPVSIIEGRLAKLLLRKFPRKWSEIMHLISIASFAIDICSSTIHVLVKLRFLSE